MGRAGAHDGRHQAEAARRRPSVGGHRGRSRFHRFPTRHRGRRHTGRDAERPRGQKPFLHPLGVVALLRSKRDHAKKKSAHAAEQERPDILKRRGEWFRMQLDLDPARLVFIDETWASTNMSRRYGRAPRGERLRAAIPHGYWKTTTFVAGLRLGGVVAPLVFDGPINAQVFEAWDEQFLVPTLLPANLVVMDNLSSYKGPRVRAMIEAAGATLSYQPPYSQPRLQ